MQLTTDYRESLKGVGTGIKEIYLICTVQFTNEERAIVQARGIYDTWIEVPPAEKPRSRASNVGVGCMTIGGVLVGGFGLLMSFAGMVMPDEQGRTLIRFFGFLILAAGIGLYVLAKLSDRKAAKYAENPNQTLTIRRLLTQPTFTVHAYTPVQAQEFEEHVRQSVGFLAGTIRASAVAGEKNTYEL
jgi:hypothetical protein